MNFNDFIVAGKVQICQKDIQKAKALVKSSKINLAVIKTISLTNASASLILVNCYESLRQILEAIALTQGYKLYSHEAYIYYLKDLSEELLAQRFDRLRKLRNGVNYYAKLVSLDVAKDANEEVIESCLFLIKKYLKDRNN